MGSAPVVDEDGVTFVLADRYRRLSGVRLVQDLGLADLAFVRERTRWWLRLPRPPVDRMEYLFEVEDANGHRHTILDPGNPYRAPGAFGDKSVLAFPEYAAPPWRDAAGIAGAEEQFEIAAPLLDSAVTGSVWTPAGLCGPAPLLVVHDGPEFAALGGFTAYLAASISAGTLPPLRAALLGPGERNVWYSANPDYATTLTETVLAALPDATARIGVGVSLGALAMLHAHRRQPDAFDGLMLQSGSFFTSDLDPQEANFSGWQPVTDFVASVHADDSDDNPVPTAMTCGVPEENLANNQRMAESLSRLGYPVEIAAVRDAHNYTAWRDALHPHLTDLITSVLAAAHAA
jgi:enterochelin esterase family protein